MTRRITIERYYIPENSVETKFDDIGLIAYSYTLKGEPVAIAYKGRSKKPYFHIRFTSEERRAEYINKAAEKLRTAKAERANYKAERKAREEKEAAAIKRGDIFINSWGYEQTNIDAYQVVGRTAKTVKIRAIAVRSVEQVDSMSDQVVPVKDEFISDEIITKRLRGTYISFEYGIGRLHEGDRAYHRSWYA